MRPQLTGDTGDRRSPTLGEAVNGVRWDHDPRQRLLSPLAAATRFFEAYPWDGEPGDAAEPAPAVPPPLPARE